MEFNIVEANKPHMEQLKKYKEQILAEKEAQFKARQEKNLKQKPRDVYLEGKIRTMTG
jgi:hypothetical protein